MVKILFLAANPANTTPLNLDQEIRSIDQALLKSQYRDSFRIEQHWAVRVTDLQALLLRHQPTIVHFSGHGSASSEIILEDELGSSQPVSVDSLAKLFSFLGQNVTCVVLNACYSERQAQALAQHVDCVVGMSRAIRDDVAITFAATFYQALGFGKDIKTAFDLGCLQIDMENLGQSAVPKLLSTRQAASDVYLTLDTESSLTDGFDKELSSRSGCYARLGKVRIAIILSLIFILVFLGSLIVYENARAEGESFGSGLLFILILIMTSFITLSAIYDRLRGKP